MKNYKTELLLYAPESKESSNCRERIFNLIDTLSECKRITQDITELQSKREHMMHEIKFLANRLLFELNG